MSQELAESLAHAKQDIRISYVLIIFLTYNLAILVQ